MLDRIYLGAGGLLIGWLGWTCWAGHEYQGAVRTMPTPGQIVVASSWYRSSSVRSHGSYSSSSSTSRSGGGVFGGK